MMTLTPSRMLTHLRVSIATAGSQRAWARRHDISEATLSSVLSGRREIPECIANALGFVKRVEFCMIVNRTDAA